MLLVRVLRSLGLPFVAAAAVVLFSFLVRAHHTLSSSTSYSILSQLDSAANFYFYFRLLAHYTVLVALTCVDVDESGSVFGAAERIRIRNKRSPCIYVSSSSLMSSLVFAQLLSPLCGFYVDAGRTNTPRYT